MISFPEKLSRYFTVRGEARPAALNDTLAGVDAIVVVPALAERDNLPRLLTSLEHQSAEALRHTAVFVIVNNSDSADDALREDNKQSYDFLRSYQQNADRRLRLGIIDCFSDGNALPVKDAGVGLARKIGLDTALRSFPNPHPRNLLICLDADCLVAENYLAEIRRHPNADGFGVGAVQYEHRLEGSEEIINAIVKYEIFLRYYVLGLTLAGSPYAHHSIGSTMLFTAGEYLACEGMNKYKAGEDFYFLEKARKHGAITIINETRVYPSPRKSFRVPFGTGRGVGKILDAPDSFDFLYAPQSFHILKEWLDVFNQYAVEEPLEIMNRAGAIHPALRGFLIERNFQAAWRKVQLSSVKQLARQTMTWFDGFATLKLIHHLRDNGVPALPITEAIDGLTAQFGIKGMAATSTPQSETEKLKVYLSFLRACGQ